MSSAVTRRDGGSVFIAADVQIKMKSSRFNKDDAALARQQLQDWISEAEETSDRTAVSPFLPIIPQGSVLRVFTSGDTLFVHNQSINLAGLSESEENMTVYTHEGSVYQATVVFYGGSGGAEIENVGTDTDGAQTFAPDQVVYASTSDDGNVTIFAGIVSQGTDSYAVGAPRLPSTDTLYTTDVSVSVAAVNGAMAPFAFTFDEQMQQVTITSTGALQSKALLSDVLFDSRRMSNGERRQHAENCLMALTDQIANDIPDEFTSGEEAMLRLGISIQTMDELLQGTGATNPTHALVQNIRGTSWGQDEVYSTYGSSLLRNIVLSLCSMKSSRVQSGKAVLAAGDEIVFYVTFTGVIRVSAGRELERFGLTQIEIEQNQAALDQAAWVKYRCRLVR